MVRPAGAITAGCGVGHGMRRAAVTTVTDIGLFALACCLLVGGNLILSVLCWLAAVVAFLVNAMLVTGSRRRTAADVAAGTVVVRTGLHEAALVAVAHGGRLAADGARQGGRLAVDGARAANQHVQRTLGSQPARQLQDTGRLAIGKARQAYARATTPPPAAYPWQAHRPVPPQAPSGPYPHSWPTAPASPPTHLPPPTGPTQQPTGAFQPPADAAQPPLGPVAPPREYSQ